VRILLEKLEAGRVVLDLGTSDGARSVQVTDVRGLHGAVDLAHGATMLREVRGRSASISGLDWSLAGGGRVTAASPATVSGAAIDGELQAGGRGLNGRASLAELHAPGLAIELPGAVRIAGDAGAVSIAVEQTRDGGGHLTSDHVEVEDLQSSIAGTLVRASVAALEHARIDWSAGGWLGGAATGAISGVVATAGGLSIEIDRIELPEGARTSGRSLVIPELRAPEVRVVVDDVVALFRRPAPTPAPPPPPVVASASGYIPVVHPPFDLGFLDRLTGRVDVDLTMDLTVPVIGRRAATHHFRIPIVGGKINYRELERDLASIEDAFIDLEVRGRALVLERAIPLISSIPGLGLEKPLVIWDLDDSDLELAKKRQVRLRTIPRMRLASPQQPGSKSKDSSSVAIRRLRFNDINIALSLAPPAAGETDSIARASVGDLRVTGCLDHDAKAAAAAGDCGANVVLERLTAGPLALPVGEVAGIEIGAITGAKLDFLGLRPTRASFAAQGVVLRGLRLDLR
jgi:hypothetical protein